MAKILTDDELLEIITKTVKGAEIDDRDQHRRFLEDLARVVTAHFGGDPGSVRGPEYPLSWTVAIHWNDSVPEDGGVYRDYDLDADWPDHE
jgi:hypothetical protein